MSINNPALYDAVIAGACLNNSVWPSSSASSTYALPAASAVLLAEAVDALITTTPITTSMRLLMTDIVQDAIYSREALPDLSNLSTIAENIVAVYNENLPNLKSGDGVGGNYQPGNFWCYQGSGSSTNVPGSAAGDVTGLEKKAVTIQPLSAGYLYEIHVNVDTYSPNVGYVNTAGTWKIIVLGSSDGGNNFPTTIATEASGYQAAGTAVLRQLYTPGSLGIDHVKVQLQRASAAASDLTYLPADAQITITELLPL